MWGKSKFENVAGFVLSTGERFGCQNQETFSEITQETPSLDAYEWCFTAVFRHQSTSASKVAFEPNAARRSLVFPAVPALLGAVTVAAPLGPTAGVVVAAAAAGVVVTAEVALPVTTKKILNS